MNIRITVILIILTLIFAVIFFYFFSQDSRITDLTLTQNPLDTTKNERIFKDKNIEIFLILKLSKVQKGEKIKISWYKNDGENNLRLMQDNSILTDNQGSGFLQISFARKNGSYESGTYQINVSLNGKPENPVDFKID